MKSVMKIQGVRCGLDSNWYGIEPSDLNTVMNYWVTFDSYKRFGLVDRKGLHVYTCYRQRGQSPGTVFRTVLRRPDRGHKETL